MTRIGRISTDQICADPFNPLNQWSIFLSCHELEPPRVEKVLGRVVFHESTDRPSESKKVTALQGLSIRD